MKLQKQLSRKHKGKEYPKYVMTIPPKIIKKLGWQAGEELTLQRTSTGFVVENIGGKNYGKRKKAKDTRGVGRERGQ